MKSGFKRFHIGACRFQVILRGPNAKLFANRLGGSPRVVTCASCRLDPYLETLGLKRRHKTRAATAGQPGPQPGNSASNRTSKQSYRLHLRLMPSTWGRGELSPFLRSLRLRSLHRHVPACRFLILSGLEATITSYQHVLGSTNLRRGRRYCRNPHHECSCSCSRVPHATCPLHIGSGSDKVPRSLVNSV